jgi:hypothetical protein
MFVLLHRRPRLEELLLLLLLLQLPLLRQR